MLFRSVAFDVLFDAFDCNLRLMPAPARLLLPILLRLKLDGLVNVLARRAAKRSLLIEWGLNQAMHVTGTPTPAAYQHAIARYTAAEISSRVTQDVLLAITQAICHYRKAQGIGGPLFLGIDMHALSQPACASALEVLAANGVDGMQATNDETMPTPAISHAILGYNRGCLRLNDSRDLGQSQAAHHDHH